MFAAWLSLSVFLGQVSVENPKKKAIELSRDEQTLLTLTNRDREKMKLVPLQPNAILMKIAREHAANMARQGKMEHKLDGKGPADRAKDAGYPFRRVGENVAWSDGIPLREIQKGWMKSPGHRANILDDRFREIGIGTAKNDKGEIYYAVVFGSRLNIAADEHQ